MALISTRIPDEIEKQLKWYAQKEKVGITIAVRKILDKGIKEIRLEYALQQLTDHSITLGRAAELAGISIWEMLDIVKRKKIDWVGLTPEAVEKDLEIAMKISKRIK